MVIQIVLTFIASDKTLYICHRNGKNAYLSSQISDFLACVGFKLANATLATAHKIITQLSFVSSLSLLAVGSVTANY